MSTSHESRPWKHPLAFPIGVLAFFLILSILIFGCGPEWIIHHRLATGTDNSTGPIGDVFGGTMGPLVAWLAAALTFLAFWVQVRANKDQADQFRSQAIDTAKDRFETRFYTLLQIHRDNVHQVRIHGTAGHGPEAFALIINELRYVYYALQDWKTKDAGTAAIDDDIIYQTAYLIVFFGCGDQDKELLEELFPAHMKPYVASIKAMLTRKVIGNAVDGYFLLAVPNALDGQYTLSTTYLPFQGHADVLSHYIRHLYQMVKFVDSDSTDALESYEQKYKYVTNIRSQLSIQEQLFIYYNSLSTLGCPWLGTDAGGVDYMTRYCMLKNLPLPVADFYRSLREVFPRIQNEEGKFLFEWDEIVSRPVPSGYVFT